MSSPIYDPAGMPAVFYGSLEPKQKDECLTMVAEQAVVLLNAMVESIIFASGLREEGGKAALERYEQRSPEEWAAIQSMMPQQYQKDMHQWGNLLSKQVRKPKQSVIQHNEFKVARDTGTQMEAL